MLTRHEWSGLKRLLVANAAINKPVVYTVPDQTFTTYKTLNLPTPIPPGKYTVYITVQSTDTDSTKSRFLFMNDNEELVSDVFLLSREPNVFDAILTGTATALYMYAGEKYASSVGDVATFSNTKIVKI